MILFAEKTNTETELIASAISKRADFFSGINGCLVVCNENKSKKNPTLEAVNKKTGIPAKYLEVIDDNDSFTAKVSPQIRLRKDIGYDVVTMTEWMAARWVASGYVQKFDDAAIPNKKNVLPFLANRPFDPGRHISLPWAGILAGLAWITKHTPKVIHTIEHLFA